MESEESDYIVDASQLVYSGFDKRKGRPYPDLRRIIRTYISDPEFRETVRKVARGMRLEILDVNEQDGVQLAPGRDSRFAMRLTDFRKDSGIREERRAQIVIIQLAIGITFFPNPSSLDDPDYLLNRTYTENQIIDSLKGLCETLVHPPEGDEELVAQEYHDSAAKMILDLVPFDPKGKKSGKFGSLQTTVRMLLDHLEANHYLDKRKTQKEDVYYALARYQRSLRRRTKGGLLDIALELVNQPGEVPVNQELEEAREENV